MAETGQALVDAVVVYALPGRAYLLQTQVPAGSTIRTAIEACGILREVPELAGQALDVGIFGRSCGLEEPVRDGDRIEIYRPLTMDPKAARRQRAALKGR